MTKETQIQTAVEDGTRAWPGSRSSSYFSTGSDAYVSKDRHTTFAEIYPPGNPTFTSTEQIKQVRAAIRAEVPDGVTVNLTGRDPLYEDVGGSEGPSLLLEVLIGGIGALLVLLFVFGTLPAVVVPLLVAACSILTTFSFVWMLTYVTDVSIIVQYLVALVGLGVAIDYSLLMIFRYREELHHGRNTEDAIVETMIHAGRSVDRVRLDRGHRPAQHDPAAAAVHPLDRDRRHAHPRRVGGRRDHARAGAALAARPPHRLAPA